MFESGLTKTMTGVLLLVGLIFAWAQRQQPLAPKLALIIQADRPVSRMSEGLHLTLHFVNVGTGSLLLFKELGAGVGRTNLRVFDEQGKEVTASFIADELPPLPPPHSKDGFIQIKKCGSYKTQLTDSLESVIHRSGTYEMVVDYTSTISERWARRYLQLPVQRIWTRERGMVVSNRIRITVTD